MSDYRENVVEWITGDDWMAITVTQKKFINKLRKIREELTDFDMCWVENPDGSVFCHLPLSCLHISKSYKRNFSDEVRNAAAERMRTMRNN